MPFVTLSFNIDSAYNLIPVVVIIVVVAGDHHNSAVRTHASPMLL